MTILELQKDVLTRKADIGLTIEHALGELHDEIIRLHDAKTNLGNGNSTSDEIELKDVSTMILVDVASGAYINGTDPIYGQTADSGEVYLPDLPQSAKGVLPVQTFVTVDPVHAYNAIHKGNVDLLVLPYELPIDFFKSHYSGNPGALAQIENFVSAIDFEGEKGTEYLGRGLVNTIRSNEVLDDVHIMVDLKNTQLQDIISANLPGNSYAFNKIDISAIAGYRQQHLE